MHKREDYLKMNRVQRLEIAVRRLRFKIDDYELGDKSEIPTSITRAIRRLNDKLSVLRQSSYEPKWLSAYNL